MTATSRRATLAERKGNAVKERLGDVVQAKESRVWEIAVGPKGNAPFWNPATWG